MVVLIRSLEFEGALVGLESVEDGTLLSVLPDDVVITRSLLQSEEVDAGVVEVLLPAGQSAYLEGDGAVPLDLLSEAVACEERRVRIQLDPETPRRTLEVRVQPDVLRGQVTEDLSRSPRILLVGEMVVNFQPGATVLDLEDDSVSTLERIGVGDEIQAFGFELCGDAADFHAFIVLLGSTDS